LPSVYLYPGGNYFAEECRELATRMGFSPAAIPSESDVALGPHLRRRLSPDEIAAPPMGTLIFHPSILPFRRGPDSVRWAVRSGDRVSGVTWFWADKGLDTGDICEQEPVVVPPGITPRDLYHCRMVPAGLRALERALSGILAGRPRRVPQEHAIATYEGWFPRPEGAPTREGARA
jgi:methionyl-tRNA formyltransferase